MAWEPFPEIDLRQLLALTDDTGMFQHALHALRDPTHGYCTDDNARALIAALLHAQLRGYDERVVPLQRYLGFVAYAFNPQNGRFRNFMSYDRRWLEEAGSEDSHGRAMWSLGLTVQLAPTHTIRELGYALFRRGLPACRTQLRHLRPWAFTLLGLSAFLEAVPDDQEVRQLFDELAHRLWRVYQKHATPDWPWWEDHLTWGNARLPQAMLIAGQVLGRQAMIDAGLRSLQWLLDVQRAPQGHLSIVGNRGWFVRGREKATFDQQPLEAYTMVDACLTAARITGESDWAQEAWRCFRWFHGHNDLGVPLYHEETGGCQDGLGPDGPNLNQGAESSLAYLLSVLLLHRHRDQRAHRIRVAPPQTLGYALIGAGRFARFCLDQYQTIEQLKPVAVWNRTTSRAQELAQERGLKAYDDLDQMLRDPAVHLVHIATTPDLHAQHALMALEQGKHVLVEKPLATTLVDAQRMIQAAAQRDRRLAVNFMMRYSPLTQPVMELIRANLLGAPLRGSYTNRAGDAGLPPDHWFWDETRSGGIFVEHGVHAFDLLRGWLGEGAVVNALRLRRPQTELVDQVIGEVRYGSQTTASFYHGFLQPSLLDKQDLRLIFERGQLRLEGWIPHRLTIDALLDEPKIEQLQQLLPGAQVQTLHQLEDQERPVQRRHVREEADRLIRLTWRAPEEDPARLYGQALRALMEDFLEAIRQPQHPMRVTAQDGRAALELALEADRIAKGVTP
ncbi:MAG TPA: Gfo/Idh/MocA family oxidoreductase [Phycisphaeraceae bacterium]